MREDHLNALLLLSIHKDIALDYDAIIEDLCQAQPVVADWEMKQLTGKHSKHNSFISHTKNYIALCLFSFSFKPFELLESNVLSHFLYSRFTNRALTLLIMPVGITGKSGTEYWPITARVI